MVAGAEAKRGRSTGVESRSNAVDAEVQRRVPETLATRGSESELNSTRPASRGSRRVPVIWLLTADDDLVGNSGGQGDGEHVVRQNRVADREDGFVGNGAEITDHETEDEDDLPLPDD